MNGVILDITVNISRVHFPVTTLGPGRRLGIWFQGCSIRCPGCISADTWDTNTGATNLPALLTEVDSWMTQAEGITISGGEPFEQPDALFALLNHFKLETDLDVLVYSGYSFEKIKNTVAITSGLIDALISEPFELSSPQTLALRGSDNQHLHLLTERGRERFSRYERVVESHERSLDVMFAEDGAVWLAGIPQRGDMQNLSELMGLYGHQIITTDDKRSL